MKKRIISPAHLEYGVTGTDCKRSINWLLVSTGMENIGRLSSNRRDSPATSASLPPGMTATNKDINQRVWQVMNLIPKGRVASYGDVAALAGHPGAARQVGRLLRELPTGTKLPWHRVIATTGKIALPKHSRSGRLQRERLEAEGVSFKANGTVDMKKFRWQPGVP